MSDAGTVTVISQNVIQVATVGIAGPRGPAGLAAPVLMGTVYLVSATNLTMPLISSARYAFTVSGLSNLLVTSGNIVAAIQINGVDVTGLSGLNVTTTPQNPVAVANNQVNVGDRLTLVLSGDTLVSGFEFTMAGSMT